MNCPDCNTELSKLNHDPFTLAMIDANMRFAVQCPKCEKTWIIKFPIFATNATKWENFNSIYASIDPNPVDIDWNEIERMRKDRMVK